MFLFLATPLTAATPYLCKRVCGSDCRGEQWTVGSTEDLCYGTICVYTTWQICIYNVCQMPLSEDRWITHVAAATCGKAIQWQDNKYTHTPYTKHTSSNKVVVTVTITQWLPTVKPQCTLANFPRPLWSSWQAEDGWEGLVHYIDEVLVWDTTLPLPAVYRLVYQRSRHRCRSARTENEDKVRCWSTCVFNPDALQFYPWTRT